MLRTPYYRLLRKAAVYVKTKKLRMRNAAPLVSFTFDDVPESALKAAQVLEAGGVRGTFYIASGTCGDRTTHWQVISEAGIAELHRQGHEVGAHTFSHANVQSLSADELEEETRANEARLKEICGEDLSIESFAYPFGDISLPRKLQQQRSFTSCRGIYEGINEGTIDLGLLKTVPLYGDVDAAAAIPALLDETIERNGWLIFYTHDVVDPPSWIGCTPALLAEALRQVQARGIEAVTVREALRRVEGNARDDRTAA